MCPVLFNALLALDMVLASKKVWWAESIRSETCLWGVFGREEPVPRIVMTCRISCR
jgi:hypothetical protein